MKLTKPIAESPIVKRMPPKKLQPSNLLPPLPEGSTGVSVLVGVGATVGEVGAAVGLVVGVAGVVVVELVVTGVVGLAVVFVVVELEVVEVTVVVDVAVVVVVLVDDELGVGGVVVPGVKVVVVVSSSGVKLVSNLGVTVLVLSSGLGQDSSIRWTSSRVTFGFKLRMASSVKLESTHSVSELLNVANLQLSRIRHPAQVSLRSPQTTVS